MQRELLDYETAADYRNRISALREIQSRQHNLLPHDREIDVVTAVERNGIIGRVRYVCSWRPKPRETGIIFSDLFLEQSSKEVLTAFLPQFYLRNLIPKEIVVAPAPEAIDTLASLFTEKSRAQGCYQVKCTGSARTSADAGPKSSRGSSDTPSG